MSELTYDAPITTTRLISNSGWNGVAFAFGLASNIVTVPYVVRSIGITNFGRAGLVIAISAPLMLIGTVLGQALVSNQSSRLGVGDSEGAHRFIDAALRLCFAASVVGWLALVFVGPWIAAFLTAEEPSPHPLRLAFSICGTTLFARQLVLVLQSICAARQSLWIVAQVSAFSAFADIGATLLLTTAMPTTDGYLGSIAAGVTLSLAAWLWALRRDIRWSYVLNADRSGEISTLLHFGRWQSVAQLAGTLSNQIDRYALGALAPVVVIGQYNVARRLQEAASIGLVKVTEVVFPHFGRIRNRDAQERGRHFQTTSWIVCTFGTMVLAPLVPLSNAVLTLWVGSDIAINSAVLLRTLLFASIVGVGADVFNYYAMGIGRNAPLAWISGIYSLFTIVLTVLLILVFGPGLAGAGTLVANLLRLGAVVVIVRRVFFPHLALSELIISTVLPIGIGVLMAFGLQWLGVGRLVEGYAHLIALYAALAAAILAVIVTASSITRSGRQIMLWTYAAICRRELH